ncbi:uncharacterized protein LOC144316461 isoform X4 [Canis aureus]
MTQFLPLGSSHPSQRKRLVITDHIPPPGADYNEVNRDERGLYSATMERERRNRFRQLTDELDFEERRGVFQTEDITNTGFVLAGAWSCRTTLHWLQCRTEVQQLHPSQNAHLGDTGGTR